jgi:hypothetical protein
LDASTLREHGIATVIAAPKGADTEPMWGICRCGRWKGPIDLGFSGGDDMMRHIVRKAIEADIDEYGPALQKLAST